MTTTNRTNQPTLSLHTVLAGLTPLIPIPFVDDWAKVYFKRRMVRALAAARAQTLTAQDAKTLADDEDTGCLLGCLTAVTVYPLKKIFRKTFYFLEWKRAVDTASRTYYLGYLIDYALEQNWCAPQGALSAAQIKAGIEAVLKQIDTRLLERTIKESFKQSRSLLKSAVSVLQRRLSAKGKPSREQVEQALADLEPQEERELAGVVTHLQSDIEQLPEEHFARLRARLAAELGFAPPIS